MESKASTSYGLLSLIETRFADPISALDMNDKFLVIGTMMGRISVFSLQSRTNLLLAEHSSENITGIQFEDDDECFNLVIGDDEMLRYQLETINNSTVPSCSRMKVYQSEAEHSQLCENSFTMLHRYCLFRISLSQPEESNVTILNKNADYDIKNVKTFQSSKGFIEMTNYSVPLDFDSERFVWVEFLSDSVRNICVFSFNSTEKPWKHMIEKSYGHVSHAKLLRGNAMLIVRDLNKCEVRCHDANFSLLCAFRHLGDEVIAIDAVLPAAEGEVDVRELVEINKCNKEKDKEVNHLNHLVVSTVPSLMKDVLLISLDVDGNVNVWNEKDSIKTVFNMYNIKEINQEEKDKQFFSMGYPYYIKRFNEQYAITSDHGCYVIQEGNPQE